MHKLPGFLPILLAILVTGCPNRAQIVHPDNPRQGLNHALAALQARKFDKAEAEFTFIIFNFPGSRQAADAQFYLAETYFQNHDYIQAQTEYDFYLKSFPNGRFQEDADYKLAMCYFKTTLKSCRDQTSTLKAREILKEFLTLYHDSKLRPKAESTLNEIQRRLTQRDFDVARLYFKAGEFKSALVYYEYITIELPTDEWKAIDRYRLAVCYQETDHTEKARPILEQLSQEDIPPALKQKAHSRLAMMNDNDR
ncbi:hypothetical protein CH330_09415 [candidate division WOR-3 bacterium JGI_Cruoil_03_51_56]|uniref:Outer membrane lipoprotein BamD-like domain-containing protein n=1 Tax=candidate division WOR-3 bacterium JGI_Cruoil_03_51_56 TaxID=1973747 RepID=A0A235BNL1_UNCW3|nr:MAG: hypothetical protein CH330_09415 [candidate division WOR-3 bacterium JGI_Cruoil_03_51_56]